MENSNIPGTVTNVGIAVAVWAGIQWFLDYVLRFFNVKSATRKQNIETELKMSSEIMEYSNDLREDIKTLRGEVVELRKENKILRKELEEFRQYVREMYDQNVILKKQNDEFKRHLNECSVEINRIKAVI